MIALHISAIEGNLYLWSEGKKVGSINDLKKSVGAINLGLKVLKKNTEDIILWLPSQGEKFIPSSFLTGNMHENMPGTKIAAFTARARPLEIEEALELASIAKDGNIAGSKVIFGSSIFWVLCILRVALKIAAEENFLPGLFNRLEYWEARWVPVPGNEDENILKKLSSCMPPVCRCANHGGETPNTSAIIVTNMILANSVDSVLRKGVTNESSNNPESVHDAWINALARKEARVIWDNKAEIKELSNNLNSWKSPINIFSQSPFNLCFKLSEPQDENDRWRVDYLLQPKHDQSIYMPLARVWDDDAKVKMQIGKFGKSPLQFILAALGQAAGLCPEVSSSLKKKDPEGFSLSLEGAYRFLKEYAQAFSAAGFKVLLPSWWVGKGISKKLGLKIKASSPKMQGSGGLNLDLMVEFDYRVSMGNDELSPEELRSLTKLKIPLVKIRGEWRQIDKNQISTALKLLDKHKNKKISARDLLALSLGSSKEIGDLEIESVSSDGWLKDLLDSLAGKAAFSLAKQPPGFRGKLRKYQKKGYSWLAFLGKYGLGACLADDMGLGKTVQTLALIQKQSINGEKRPVLVVCPTSVVNNWLKEARAFTPNLKVFVHHGSDRKKRGEFAKIAEKKQIIISSYGLLRRDINFLKKIDWAVVVLDEAQNIKNPETKQSKAARCLQSGFSIILTGTPVENHVGDLWALMDFLNPGLLGTQSYFKSKFYNPIQVYNDQEAAAKLKSVTSPFILRREKTDKNIISDLPEKIEIKDYCNLTKEQASLYKAVVDEMEEKVKQAEGIDRRGLILSTITKLKQVCNHPALFAKDNSTIDGRSGKLERLVGILAETIELGERSLVFTQYSQLGEMLKGYLQDYFVEEVFLLHGGTSRKKRDEMIDIFQGSGNAPHIFVLSIKAGGTGLNLTRANHVIHFDRWWNPAVENQATDRAFRIGQKRNVGVHKFIVAGTLEERIDEMIESKINVAKNVIGAGEDWLTELSNEDFYNLIKLSTEAIGE